MTYTGSMAFQFCVALPRITIPAGVTEIRDGAFNGCASVANFSIPSGVTRIWPETFALCINATNITIPPGVTRIDANVFNGCYSLTSLTLPSALTTLGESVFSQTGLTNLSIPNGVTILPANAFFASSNLTSVTLPASITTIRNDAFYNCVSLTSITLPPGLSTVNNFAFRNVPNLMRTYFTGNRPTEYAGIFDATTNVTVYRLPGSTGWGALYADRPVVTWDPEFASITSMGDTNQLSIISSGVDQLPVGVETTTNLFTGPWTRLFSTNFSGALTYNIPADPNAPERFYRIFGP